MERQGRFHAHDAGFDLHAGVTIAAYDRAGLEQLCHYVFRPPLGQQRLRRLADGRIAVALQRPWADGTDPAASSSRAQRRTAPHRSAMRLASIRKSW